MPFKVMKRLDLNTYVEESARVFVAVGDADCSTEDADVLADAEVRRHEWAARAVLLEHHLSVQEGALGGA